MKVILKDLSKQFGEVKAVNNLDLEINDGKLVALLGPSGCGKTTTLLMVAGIYEPTKGYIYFNDRIINKVLAKDRKIGMVFQSYALYPHMNVLDNIVFPLKLKKVPREEMKKRAISIARLGQIEGLLDRKPTQISGGQQQRVALCRALIKEPEVLLLDEPLSNLDARLRIAMRAELKKLQRNLGITTIFVTHDQVEAMTMSDKVAVINKGSLQQFSTPDELYDYPKNSFVASFIGSPPMNLIYVLLETSNGKFILKNRRLQIALQLPREIASKARDNATTSELRLGIRPEHIILNSEKKNMKAEIYMVEHSGREILVTMKRDDLLLKVLTVPPFEFKIGDKIWIDFNLEKILLFDEKNQKSVLY